MAIQRVGWRPYVSPALSASTLLTSIYGVWNAETTTTTLATGAYGAWNAEGTVTTAQLATGAHGAWNGEKSGASLDANILRVYAGDDLNDTSGNAQNATNVGGVTFAAGKFGNAFTFNGSNNISLPDNSLNSLTGDFTVSMWVKVQNTGTLQTLFSSIGSDGTNYHGFTINNYGGIYTTIYTGSGSTGISLNELSPNPYNTWYHVVVTRKAGTRTRIYYNGVNTRENADANNAIYYSGVNKVNIGAFYSSSYRVANGTQIDAVTIWRKELNPGEVLSLYNFGNGAQYPYSTLSLPSSNDVIGSNDGILTGGCLVASSGKIGKSFYFDGVNDYVKLPTNSLNFASNFSVNMWVYVQTTSALMSLISAYDYNGTSSSGWILNIKGATNQIIFEVYQNGTPNTISRYAAAFTTSSYSGQWVNIGLVRKSSTSTKIYVNGSEVVGSYLNGSAADNPTYATTNCTIGALLLTSGGVSNPCIANTQIDAVATWQKELSSDEVLGLYNAGSGNQYPFASVTVGTTADSVSTNHGTIVGGVTYATGIVGNAFTFNGTTGYVSLPNNSLNSLTGDFSVSTWVNLTSLTTRQCILSNYMTTGVSATDIKGFRIYYGASATSNIGGIRVDIGDGVNNVVTLLTNNYLTSNAWYHIAVTRKSSTGTNIYINGVLSTSNSSTVNPAYTTAYPRLGVAQYDSNLFDWYISNGSKIDSTTIWNKVLTDDEITQLYNMGGGIQYPFTTQTIKAPYAAYNGDSLVDPIGARNAAIVGGVTYTAGKVGNAYTFNGSTGYLTLPANSMRFAGSLSISMWVYPTVYPTTAQGQIGLISNTSGGYKEGFDISLYNPTGNVSTYIQFGNGTAVNGGYAMAMTPSALPLNTWTLLTVTFEAGVGLKAYYNGVLQASVSSSATTLTYANMPATYTPTIGYGSNATGPNYGVKFAGQIDGLTFWNSALTAPEVITLFNDGSGMEYPYSSTLPAKLPSYGDAVGTNHGTSPATSAPTFTVGKIGKAFLFDGVNDHILLPSTALKFTGDFSVSLWVYIPVDSATNQTLIGCLRQPSGWRGWDINIYSNRIYFEAADAQALKSYAYITSTNIAAWKHVVATFKNGTGGKLYVDNVLRGSFAMTTAIAYDSVHTPSIGAMKYAPNTTWYVQNGTKMDAISTWTKELSSTEITDLYNSGNGKQYPSY